MTVTMVEFRDAVRVGINAVLQSASKDAGCEVTLDEELRCVRVLYLRDAVTTLVPFENVKGMWCAKPKAPVSAPPKK
ncbi:MAG TPA: hypothetical protein VEA41_15305 [Salinarimonas sp.]|nr:hypothetical protein [Salinarimonas sp.]